MSSYVKFRKGRNFGYVPFLSKINLQIAIFF